MLNLILLKLKILDCKFKTFSEIDEDVFIENKLKALRSLNTIRFIFEKNFKK